MPRRNPNAYAVRRADHPGQGFEERGGFARCAFCCLPMRKFSDVERMGHCADFLKRDVSSRPTEKDSARASIRRPRGYGTGSGVSRAEGGAANALRLTQPELEPNVLSCYRTIKLI